MSKQSQKLTRLSLLARIINPYFRQALIWRQLACRTPEVLTLDAGANALGFEPIHP
jgi:hypothetical protein